jgi:hypothetical protein
MIGPTKARTTATSAVPRSASTASRSSTSATATCGTTSTSSKKDPANRVEVARLLEGRQARFPAKLEADRWYALVVETVGDTMRVTIDGQPAGFLKSSGIAHATKSKIELGVAGKDGYFDDIKVWNAQRAQ